MPSVRKQVVAICWSDLHLSLKAPVARAEEEDWLEAQERILSQVRKLAEEYKADVLCAGDVFDRWNSPPELINWALEKLPQMYAIPGQHDLPLHSLELINRSAYWTLKKAKKIVDLFSLDKVTLNNNVCIHGFPWGKLLKPPPKDGQVHVALVHKYVWMKGKSFPGAPEESRVDTGKKETKGWDAVIFGDNHKGFLYQDGKTIIFNCGGFLRRKSDEINYQPQVGLLYEDGTIQPYTLDCSADKITATGSVREAEEDMELKDFLEELTKLQDSDLDFRDAMKRVLEEKKPSQAVRNIILKAMESKEKT